MTKTWTSPETKREIQVVVVKSYPGVDGEMLLVHKTTASSAAYVFGVRAVDCREAA